MNPRLQGKVAAIYGASGGMGRATAVALAERGARIAASGRSGARLAQLVDELNNRGCEAESFPADLEDPDRARDTVAAMLDRFGRIDILVYATGTNIERRTLEETT